MQRTCLILTRWLNALWARVPHPPTVGNGPCQRRGEHVKLHLHMGSILHARNHSPCCHYCWQSVEPKRLGTAAFTVFQISASWPSQLTLSALLCWESNSTCQSAPSYCELSSLRVSIELSKTSIWDGVLERSYFHPLRVQEVESSKSDILELVVLYGQ